MWQSYYPFLKLFTRGRCLALINVILKLFAISLALTPALALNPLKVEKGRLVDGVEKRPIGLFGVNLFESHLDWTISQNIKEMEENLVAIRKYRFNAIRVPLNMSYIEPAPDIFPDNPHYSEIMRQHNLKDGFLLFLDALVKKAEELEMYVILEFHELPSDPWRYFAGGNEQLRGTGKHGGAISWMAKLVEKDGKIERAELDWDKAYEYVPKALAWLAHHYKGNPVLAGIEVPWNEPVGGWAEDDKLYYRLVQACARAIKKEDPNRLVFMNIQDWGAGVNFLPPSSTWRTPPEVDVLSPHFYFGMHCPNTPYEQALRCAVANWASWFTGWDKPIVIGEYGTAGMTREWLERHREELEKIYPISEGKIDISYLADDVIRACFRQWKAMGIQGVFYWAWWRGVPPPGVGKGNLRISENLTSFAEFAPHFKKPHLVSSEARIAVLCDINKRSQYGSSQDLLAISDILVTHQFLPFHTLFTQAISENKDILKKRDYKKVILLADGIPQETLELVRQLVPKERLFILHQEAPNWWDRLLEFLKG